MPPVLCDFETIIEDSPITIGNTNTIWTKNFNTGGGTIGTALLIFNVQGFTRAINSAEVKINGIEVGRIYPYALTSGANNDQEQNTGSHR